MDTKRLVADSGLKSAQENACVNDLSMESTAIIIVNWNGSGDTIECVESILDTHTRYERIIVVDNGSEGEDFRNLTDRLGNFAEVIRSDKNLGFAAANNIGIIRGIEMGCTHILLLNNDTVVTNEFIREMHVALREFPEAGIVGPKILYYDKPDRIWAAGGRFVWWIQHFNIGMNRESKSCCNTPKVVDFASGACMLIKAEVAKSIGGLPTDYFMGMEDVDYCLNAGRHGYLTVFWPKALIYHKVSASYKRGNLDYLIARLGVRNAIIVRSRHFSRLRLAIYLCALILIDAPIHIISFLAFKRDPELIGGFVRGLLEGTEYARGMTHD